MMLFCGKKMIHKIDEYRKNPHINIRDMNKNVHVYPVAFFSDVIDGNTDSYQTLIESPEVLRTIIKDWLRSCGYEDDI
jgi:hypothetical protein